MKKTLLLNLITLALTASAHAQHRGPDRDRPFLHPRQPQPALNAVYQAIGPNDQLVTTNFGEASPTYRYQTEVSFYVSQTEIFGAAQMNQIYRCFTGNTHFVSTSSNCEGLRVEGSYGWVFKNPSPGLLALRRYYSPSRGSHYITTNESEVSNAYQLESILGYVFPRTQLQYPVPIPAPTSWIPVYASSNGKDNFLSLTFGEGSPGYVYRGTAFYVLENAAAANGSPLKVLYRCFTGGAHFASTDGNCEGLRVEGRYGYIYASPTVGTVPLYRFYSPSKGIHLITANPAEANSDYYAEGILGYVGL